MVTFRRAIWLLIVFLLALQIWKSRAIFDPWIMHDDFRQNCFWVPKMLDPELFPGDYLANYANDFSTVGINLLYRIILTVGIDSITGSKLISLGVYTLFLLGVFRLGRIVDRSGTGLLAPILLAMVLANSAYFLSFCMGGISRSLAFPLQAWLMGFLLERRLFPASILVFLSAIFHPQSFLLGGSLVFFLGAFVIYRKWKLRPIRLMAGFAAFLMLCGAILFWLRSDSLARDAAYGPLVTKSQIAEIPEYQQSGRWEHEKPQPFVLSILPEIASEPRFKNLIPLQNQHRFLAIAFLLYALGATIWLYNFRRHTFLRIWPLFLIPFACIAWYFVCMLMLPKLYFPNRFLRPALPLMVYLMVAFGVTASLSSLISSRRISSLTALSLLCFTLAISQVSALNVTGYKHGGIIYKPLVEFLKTLPKDVLLAAFPMGDADDISVLAERSVYLQNEISHPLYFGFLKVIRDRTEKNLRALFTTDTTDLLPLRDEGVDYIIIPRNRFRLYAEGRRPVRYMTPYDKILEAMVEKHGVVAIREFWEQGPEAALVYKDHAFLVYDMNILLSSLSPSPVQEGIGQ